MNFKLKKEPITGQARELEIANIHLQVNYQEILKTEAGEEIMKSEIKTFSLGNMPMHMDDNEGDKKKKEVIKQKIAELVHEYLNA